MLISLPVSLTSLAMIISALFPEASHGILSCLLWLSDGSLSMYPIFVIPYGRLCLQIFFPILRVIFFFHFIVFFAIQVLLRLIRSHLFIFVLFFIPLSGGSKKNLLRFLSKRVLPIFSSRVSRYLFFRLDL